MTHTHDERPRHAGDVARGQHAPPGGHGGHETTDAKIRPLITFGLGLVLLSIVTFFAMRAMFDSLSKAERAEDSPRHPLATGIEIPPEPRLEPMPGYDLPALGADGERPFATRGLAEHRREEQETLDSYGWIDRQAGIVRVPIGRAIELTLTEGLPIAGEKKR
jgi:hypothetical protein